MASPAAADPVCAEPKLFVGERRRQAAADQRPLRPAALDALTASPAGGLRFECSRDEVFSHFSQYGPIRTCVLLKHQDTQKSKGCAMVLFTKWAHAEAAVNAENGTASHLSSPRQLIVKFADPQRRQEDGVLVGVTPKKLFVGQVSCRWWRAVACSGGVRAVCDARRASVSACASV